MTVDFDHFAQSRLANIGGSELTLGRAEIREIAL
jgi:hypothetical protein